MGTSKVVPIYIRRSKTKEFIAAWHVKDGVNRTGYGLPTKENLEKWRNKFNQSCKPDGCNAHLGVNGMINYQIEIFHHKKGILAVYNPPMFEEIDWGKVNKVEKDLVKKYNS